MDIRQKLRRRYLDSMPRKIESLEHVLEQLALGASGAEARARSLCHQLVGSGATYGFPDISRLALAAEASSLETLASALRDLITHLTDIYAAAQGDRQERILIIEDDEDMAAAFVDAAREFTEDTTEARTAAEAKAAVEETEYSLVILDLMLADSDGREVLSFLRERPYTSNTPVIVVTAAANLMARIECVKLGVDHFLQKPVDLGLMSATIAAALKRGQTFRAEARRDPLTGLKNRAGFREALESHLALTRREGQPMAIAIIDLDRFKAVNDTYGHAMGDVVLKGLAELLRARLRLSDISGRWGGEEFVVAFPNTSATGAAIVLRKLAGALVKLPFQSGDRELVGLTFSAGVVDIGAEDQFEDSLEEADRLLYAAKGSGRNRVVEPGQEDRRSEQLVLIAEDDVDTARLLRTLLEGEGLRVRVSRDGQDAVDQARSDQFDAVILDWQMPRLAGNEALRALRAMPNYERVPILMLTALGDEKRVAEAFELGADDYVFKPFRPRELVARVRRLLARI